MLRLFLFFLTIPKIIFSTELNLICTNNYIDVRSLDVKDVFFKPVDIGDTTIPNGNAIMLINLIRLGMMDEAKKLSDSLNGYLNVYKSHMMTSLRAIDYFNNLKEGKNCNELGCKIDD